MADQLARPTKILRTTVAQEARIILEPCVDDKVRLRRVQLLVPDSPAVFVALDQMPADIGPNRTYKLPRVPAATSITLLLLPEQYIVAAAKEGQAFLGLVVEYLR